MIKGYRISFKSSVMSQKCYKMLQDTSISFLYYFRFERNKQKGNFHYAAMSMMTSQILKFVDFPKPRKTRYLEDESLFCCYTSRATLWQKILL